MTAQTARPRTFIAGDMVEYTGETRQIHGGLFYVVEFVEGAAIGQTRVTQRPPLVGPGC